MDLAPETISQAAEFHAVRGTAALTARAKRYPDAWRLYAAWDQWHPDPASVPPGAAAASIERFAEVEYALTDAKWTGRTDPLMHDVAEALGIDTNLVLSVMLNQGVLEVFYTPDYDEDAGDDVAIYAARLATEGGVLRRIGEPKLMPGMWAKIKANLDDSIGGDA